MSELLQNGVMTTLAEQLFHSKKNLEQLKEKLNEQTDPYRVLTIKQWLFDIKKHGRHKTFNRQIN